MDFMTIFDDCISFAKDKINVVTNFWDGLEEDQKKLFLACMIGGVAIIAVATIAYALGKSSGRKLAFDEEDF